MANNTAAGSVNRNPNPAPASPPPMVATVVPVSPLLPKVDTTQSEGSEVIARKNQTQCPHCGKWGCPASRGTHQFAAGVRRYRECTWCKWVFTTWQPRVPESVEAPE